MGRPKKSDTTVETTDTPVVRRRRTAGPQKTIIKFKFLKAGPAFSIDGHGNFWPKMAITFKQLPQVAGNYAEQGYDLDEIITLELDSERPRDLPQDVTDESDDAVRTAYRIKQAEAAAAQHEKNNLVRDELYYHEEQGTIEILSDSFMDDPAAAIPSMTELVETA
jgi:hypothetical protein